MGNIKIEDIGVEKNIDTLLLSINMGKFFSLSDILKDDFYEVHQFQLQFLSNRRENFCISTNNVKIDLRSLVWEDWSNYLTIKISSIHKLQRDLGITISHEKGQFAKDIKEKIIDQLIVDDIDPNSIYIKEIDLALDLKFPEVYRFEHFSNQLTNTIMNMHFPYLEGNINTSFNTGYFISRNGNRRMRFYNKELKEKGDNSYLRTYRIEYRFDSKYQIDRYLGSNKIKEVDVSKGFNKIINICHRACNKYREKVEEFFTGNLSREGDSMLNKYSYSVYGSLLCESSWKLIVDANRIFSGKRSIFSDSSEPNYYKKNQIITYSFITYLMKNDLKEYYDLFYKVISQQYRLMKMFR